MNNCTIGLVQMVSGVDVEANLQRAEVLLRDAAEQGAKVLFLPENFAALASPDVHQIAAGEANASGPIRQFLTDQAKSLRCWIVGGTLPTTSRLDGSQVPGNRVRAACLVLDDHGQEVSRYDKIHMFDVDVADNQRRYRESDTFEPGEDLALADTPAGRLGLTVCYDIRFPSVYQRLMTAGAEVLSIPSAFTRPTGEAHFEVLMRARAIETLSYAVAACQGGDHDSGRQTWGHSMVVGPWGDILGQLESGEGTLVVELDLEAVRARRTELPVLHQRRAQIDI